MEERMGLRRSRILGIGSYVPPRVVTNKDLTQWMETSDEWIVERTGIRERRWVEEGSNTGSSDLALEAAKRALEAAEMPKEKIQLIVFATLSPDHDFPGTGVFLQRKLGLGPMPVLDVRQQCTGFIYALSVADQFIRTGAIDHALVVGAEVHSTGLDVSTRGRDVAVLFGDGAGAAVLGPSEDDRRGILSSHLYADGTLAESLWVEYPSSIHNPRLSPKVLEEGGHYPKMDGKKVFKHAVSRMPEVVHEALAKNGYKVDDLAMLLPHQANLRFNELVQKSLGLPDEKVWNNIHKYGNTTAATIPLCFDEALRAGRIKRDDLVCLVAFGAGFTWASMLIRW
jgi:3-oxoacyl-[acyl-carrier-protein] synthase-3